jgi:hypothetical protein
MLIVATHCLSAQSNRGAERLEWVLDTTPRSLSMLDFARTSARAFALYNADSLRESIPLFERMIADNPHDPYVRTILADAHERTGNCAAALVHRRRVLAIGAPEGRGAQLFRIARCHVKLGAKDSAFHALERALAAGYESRQEFATHPALESLRSDPRFPALAGVSSSRAGTSRTERWQRDIDFFVSEAKRLHVSVARGDSRSVAQSTEFRQAAASLRVRVPNLTDERINIELRRLAVMLDDGHSMVSIRLGRIPLDLHWFADGMYVVGTKPDLSRWYGARVERVGTMDVRRAMLALAPLVHRDNEFGLLVHGPRLLAQPQVAHAIGASADTGSILLGLRTQDGRLHTVSFRAESRTAAPWTLLLARGIDASQAPIYQRDTSVFRIQALPEDSAVYVGYGIIGRTDALSVRRMADSILATVSRSGASNLILDLRNNTGGETAQFPPMLAALSQFARSGPGRQLYVLINRLTFSAAQNFATTIERFIPSAVFVGEPTGSRPNFVGEATPVRLPFSGLTAVISSRFNQNTDFNDDRRWVQVEYPAPLTSVDYFSGRDPGVDGIRDLIRSRRQGGS